MPQLNVADFLPQLIWLFITLGAMYWLMTKVALPKIGDAIEQRHGRIASDLAEAARLKAMAEQVMADYQAEIARARSEAHAIALQNRAEMTAQMAREQATLDVELGRKVADAEARIAATKQAAMSQVEAVAQDAAEEIVARLIGRKPSREAVVRAVAAAVKT